MRLKLFALVAAISVATAAFFLAKPALMPDDNKGEPCVGDDCGAGGSSAEEELAQRFAPVVYLADSVTDCGLSAGDFRPVPVETVLGNQAVSLRQHGQSESATGATAPDLYKKGSDYYLDLPGNPRRPGCRFLTDGQNFAAGQPNVAYARLITEDGFDELVLQYWVFYYFNQWNNKHEGDWEMIQLVFEAGSAAEALTQEPLRIAYSQHSDGELALWDDDKLEREGDRPVLHVAAGSHSNRFTPKVFLGRGEQGFGCDDATGLTRISLETRLIPETISGPNDPYAWLTFEGRWGELAGSEFDGPTGPNQKRQWLQPLSWEEDLRTSSVRLPSRDTIGPSAVDAFCNVVAWGSNLLLPIYLQVPNASIALVGLLSVGMVISLTRTRYIPAMRYPLRARRRIGQVLLSAFTIYGTNSRLLIGIGLVFLPLAITISVLHWLVLSVSPIEPIVPVPRADVGQDLIIAFALSELQFGMAYGVVLVACTAALAAIEQNRHGGVREAYLSTWYNLLRFLPPRLFAIVFTAGMAFTVVGIPLAIRQAIRWSFIEQAVFLDGARARDALNLSAEVVDRDWWWTAASVLALGAVGLFAAPAAGIILILAAQSIPLADVNLITSVIHVALVPFVAVAYSLIYFDLQSRGSSE
jgi:hypothetical protein